jgi:hypothetical protein
MTDTDHDRIVRLEEQLRQLRTIDLAVILERIAELEATLL